jgi:cytochrome c
MTMRRTAANLTVIGVLVAAVAIGASLARTAHGRTGPGASLPDAPPDGRFGLGTPATAAEIRLADTDVRPDGHGLPHDSGTVAEGQVVFAQQCASCHGATGVEGPYDKLVGRVPGDSFNFARDARDRAPRTIGSYWPYATTVYDYVNRAMPQSAPGSLTPHQVYSVVAYLLYRNQIIPATATMNERTLPAVVMPAHGRFVADDRLQSRVVR